MNISLKNGFNSLIAYYFRTTNFPFLDEYDLRILVNIANMCGIQLSIDNSQDMSVEIFNQFLTKLDELIEGTWHKGIVGSSANLNWIYTHENHDWKSIRRLAFYDRFVKPYFSYTNRLKEYSLVPELLEFLDKMIGTDMEVLMSRMPKPDILKKYMTLKKIVLCKTPNNHDFYNNIPSNEYYDSFDDWSRDIKTRGIYPQTYEFIEYVEQSILHSSQSLIDEEATEPPTLAKVPNPKLQ